MGERLTRAAAAERQGVSRQRIDELINQGKLTEERATVDADELDELWATFDADYVHRDRAGKAMREDAGDAEKPKGPDVNAIYNTAKAKMQALKANALELDLQIKRGAFVSKEVVTQQAYSAAKAFTTKCNNLPRRLAPQLAVLINPVEIEALLQKEVDQIIKELRDDLGGVG